MYASIRIIVIGISLAVWEFSTNSFNQWRQMSPRTVSTFHSSAGLNAIPYSSTHEWNTLNLDVLAWQAICKFTPIVSAEEMRLKRNHHCNFFFKGKHGYLIHSRSEENLGLLFWRKHANLYKKSYLWLRLFGLQRDRDESL